MAEKDFEIEKAYEEGYRKGVEDTNKILKKDKEKSFYSYKKDIKKLTRLIKQSENRARHVSIALFKSHERICELENEDYDREIKDYDCENKDYCDCDDDSVPFYKPYF